MSETPATGLPATDAYPSLAALRAAHTDLLRRQRGGVSPELLGAAADFIRRGAATGALIDDEDDRTTAQSHLDYWSTVLIRNGYDAPDATLAEADPSLAPELPEERCPYVGLDAFREQDADKFFGRRRLVEFLVKRLAEQRLLVLVGPSGSGKSSTVRAGLIPALKSGAIEGSAGWRYLPTMVPGEVPLEALAATLIAAGLAAGSREEVAAQLREPDGLLRMAAGEQPALLVVDQLEELFTLADDEEERKLFVAALVSLIEAPGARHTVVMTLRADFENYIALEPALQSWFEQARVQLLPLNAAEMRDSIERPAELAGLKFEPGVVDALLHDMLGEPAALPLLQFTLLKLWDARERNRVTWEAYRKLGGGRRALAQSADAFYNGLIEEDKVTARRLLLRMVRPGEGLEVTSHRVRRDQLYRAGEARDRVDRVLERLVAARLVRLTPAETPGSAQVEVAHEALVRNWRTLVGWLEDEKASMATRRRLEAKAAEWVRLGRGSAGLLDEVQLAEAERWLSSAEAAYLGYDEALADLVDASDDALGEARKAREAADRAALEQAQALAAEQKQRAEAESRAASRLRLAVFALALALIGAIVSAVVLIGQQSTITTQALQMQTQAIAASRAGQTAVLAAGTAEAAAALESGLRATAEVAATQESGLRATAVLAAGTAEAAAALESGLRATAVGAAQTAEAALPAARAGELAAQARAEGLARPLRGILLATEALDVTLARGDAPLPVADATLRAALTQIGGVGLNTGTPLSTVVASADGSTVVAAGADGTLRIWTLGEQIQSRTISAPEPVARMVLSSDGRRLVTAAEEGTSARLWDLSAADGAVQELPGAQGRVNTVAISPDGSRAAIGDDNGSPLLFDLAQPAAPRRLSGLSPRGPVAALTFSPNGQLLLTGSADGQARIYDVRRGSGVSLTQERVRGAITSVAFSPDGGWVAYGTSGSDVRLWRLSGTSFNQVSLLRGHTARISTIAFAPNSGVVVAGSTDGTTCVWTVGARAENASAFVLRGHRGAISGLAISADSASLLTASADGTVGLWDLRATDPGANTRLLRGHDDVVTGVALAQGGASFVSTSADGTARVWPLDAATNDEASLPQSPAELLAFACRTAGRALSEGEEWPRFFAGEPYAPACQP